MLTQAKREFIEFMMSADVLRFGNFVTKSGRNTPYFVNIVSVSSLHTWASSMPVFSMKLWAISLTPCSARLTRVSRWQL